MRRTIDGPSVDRRGPLNVLAWFLRVLIACGLLWAPALPADTGKPVVVSIGEVQIEGWEGKAKADSEKDGPLVKKVDSVFLAPTDYSKLK